MCDRCTDYFDLPISGRINFDLQIRRSEDMDDENVMTVYPGETDINIVAQPIYEAIVQFYFCRLAEVHPEGMCNQEMLQDIDKYLMVEEKPTVEILLQNQK
jgi:hypothetical protein